MIDLRLGDCLEVLPALAADSFDCCVTDPPYGLQLMGRTWDHGVPGIPYWEAVHRVLKPGAVLLAFGGTRTYHRMACAVEDAGFAVEDSIHWIYAQGFPKHKSKLKPAHEPIVLARKPGPKWLGVDAGRVAGTVPRTTQGASSRIYGGGNGLCPNGLQESNPHPAGRYPPNLCFSHHPDCQQCGTKKVKGTKDRAKASCGQPAKRVWCEGGGWQNNREFLTYNDPDGLEEVAAWACVEGEVERRGIASLGSTEIDLTSAEEDELFAFAGLLVRALRDDSRTVDRRENPGCEPDRAVPESGSPGFQAGCPSCHRSGDALFHQIRVASQESARRLADVLESALCRAHLSSHSHPDQPDGHPSSCDASPLSGATRSTEPSKNAGDPLPAFLPEKVDHTPRRGAWEPPSNGPHGSNGESSNGESGAPGIRFCSDCRTEAVRRFCLSCAYWASKYFLRDLIIRIVEARVNYCPVAALDEQAGERSSGGWPAKRGTGGIGTNGHKGQQTGVRLESNSGPASRFYPTFAWGPDDLAPFLYCPKAGRRERNAGLEGMPQRDTTHSAYDPSLNSVKRCQDCHRTHPNTHQGPCVRCGSGQVERAPAAMDGSGGGACKVRVNDHPTVKPLALMRWLCRLACPAGGAVLDPFLGSGTTALAALAEGFHCTGIEREPAYLDIARARLDAARAAQPLFA